MRVGVVGTGWGRMHVGGFRAAGAEIAAICGRDAEKTRRIADEEGIPIATTELARLCAEVDAVVVASPDALHREHVRAAIDAGRHVLCEKPLACTVADAADMVAWARASSSAHAVCFPYRMLPPLAALARWIGDREVRRVVAAVRNSFLSPAAIASSGDLGGLSHVVDATRWLARAPATSVSASTDASDGSTSLRVGLSRGGEATIAHVASTEPGIRGTWLLAGDRFEATFDAGYLPALGGWTVSNVRGLERGCTIEIAPGAAPRDGEREPWAEAHVETARCFLRAIAGEASTPLATFEDGLDAQRVIDAARRSSSEGRTIAIEERRG